MAEPGKPWLIQSKSWPSVWTPGTACSFYVTAQDASGESVALAAQPGGRLEEIVLDARAALCMCKTSARTIIEAWRER